MSQTSTFTATDLAVQGADVGSSVVGVGSAVGAALTFTISALPIILVGIVIGVGAGFWAEKQPEIMEEGIYLASNELYPLWRDTLRDLADLTRRFYNAVICPFDGTQWWLSGVLRNVVFPLIRRCHVKPVITGIFNMIVALMKDVVLFIASGRFLNEFTTFTHVTPAGIALFQAWIDFYKCLCLDLGQVAEALPIPEPLLLVPPTWTVTVPLTFFSAQWTDPQWWCALENAFNAVIALIQQAWRLITQIILLLFYGGLGPGRVFERPDFRDFVTKACPAIACFMRSTENAYQRLWDMYVPFKFVFYEYLCILDTAACILLKTAAFAFRLLINIDQCVLYPENDFWERVMKRDMTEIINLWVAPTNWETIRVPSAPLPLRYNMMSYYWDLNSPITPDNKPNPIYGMKRLDECICIFITRTICDPSSTDTGCFSQGAQNLLMGLDFCCLTNNVLKTLADFVTGLVEFSYHLSKGPDDFFLFVDKQPFTTVLRLDLVPLARCILSVFGLIPVVGTCIRELLVGIIAYLLGLIDFFLRVLIGLLTLPYFIVALPSIPNFLQQANLALQFWVDLHEALITDNSSSVKNCLCVILNNGFPVPPIPCATCQVSGYVDPPAFKKRQAFFDHETGQVLNSPVDMMRRLWGIPDDVPNEYPITPLLYYENHTSNPITLYNMIRVNVRMLDKNDHSIPRLDDLNKVLDKKQREIMERWHRIKRCNRQHEEARALQQHNPRLYEYNRRKGMYDCDPNEHMMGGPLNRTREQQMLHQVKQSREERLNLGPTIPPIIGCDPKPPCYDLCCLFRTSLVLIVHTLQALARFMNGIIQGSASLQGTMQDYPYFTGEFAKIGQPTFETDLVQFILDLFKPVKCGCEILNLIIPVTPQAFSAGRPDICCAIQRISELIACIVQVIYNTINAIAMGQMDNFLYFRGGFFYSDVSMIFDIMLAVVDCLCIAAHAIFPLDYIPGFAAASDFDICCAAQAILVTLIEIARGALQAIIALATITIDQNAYCFWRLDRTVDHPNCAGTLDGIGLIKQLDVIIDSFLPKHGEDGGLCLATCKNDNGATGIVPCICQVFNTLIPWREDPSRKVNCNPDPLLKNCPRTDFCCPFSKLGFFISDSLKFVLRALVALWQPWNGLPEFFINYIFCDEGQVAKCPNDQIIPPNRCELQKYKKIPDCPGIYPVLDSNSTFQNRCGAYTCGKLNIVIKDLTDPFEGLISRCTCQFIGLLDQLIALLFKILRVVLPQSGWSCCFCGGLTPDGDCNINTVDACSYQTPPGTDRGSSGILTGLSYTINQILVALFGLIRKFPLSCYWKPCVPSITEPVRCPNNVPQKLDETWIFSFLAPTVNALAVTVGNVQCLAQSMFLLPRVCLGRGEKWLGSVIRWVGEIIMRVIGFIETFITVFIAPDNTCVGPTCDQKPGTKVQTAKGVNAKDLGKMMVILLSIPNDITIGDSEVACTTICPSAFAVPAPTRCGCWNNAPLYGGGTQVYTYTNNNAMCLVNTTDANGNTVLAHVGGKWLLNKTDVLIDVTVAEGGSGYVVGNVLDISGGSIGRVYVSAVGPGGVVTNIAPAAPGFGYVPALNVSTTGGQGTGARVNILNTQTGCCLHQDPTNKNAIMPICVNPDEAVVQPGPCAELAACRPDALPSIANDPSMPPALAANYFGAADGLIMGLTRYMKCILNNLFCNPDGTNCVRIGTVLYPAVLIQSIVWQILGGFIRFIVSCILFFFSLFTPPDGNGCLCWNTGTFNGWGTTVTHYHARVSGLCYRCRLVGWDCSLNYMNARGDVKYEAVPCPDYCPYNQQLRNPGIDATTAMNLCLSDFANATKISNATWVTGPVACNPPAAPYTIPNVCVPWTPAGCGNVTFTTDQYGFDGYLFNTIAFTNPDSTFFDNRNRFLVPDLCIRPQCQYNGPAGDSNTGWIVKDYPGWAANEYPSNPLVTCGVIQIIQNFLDVFNAFVAVFTTPLIIPQDQQVRKRGGGSTTTVKREAFQEFRHRMRHEWKESHHKRYDGTTYFQDYQSYPNFAVALAEAAYGYDTSDCYADPVTCACRNLDLSNYCTFDTATQQVRFQGRGQTRTFDHVNKREIITNMTDADLMTVVGTEVFADTNVCDHVTQGCTGMSWSMVKDAEKNQWVKCVDKRIQGERLNALSETFPKDIMYNSHAPLSLAKNLFGTAYQANQPQAARQAEMISRGLYEFAQNKQKFQAKYVGISQVGIGEQQNDNPDPNHTPHVEFDESSNDDFDEGPIYWDGLQEELIQRAHFASEHLTTQLNIPPHSPVHSLFVKMDQTQYKYDRGFYGRLLRKAARNIQLGGPTRLPKPTEALDMMRDSFVDLWHTVGRQPYQELWNATHSATRMLHGYVSDVVDEGITTHMWRMYDRYIQHKESMMKPIIEKRQKQFATMVDHMPLVKWWTYMTGNETSSTTTTAAPRFSFWHHLSNVVSYQRQHWQSEEFSFFSADLRFWSFKDMLMSRWNKPEWTPEKLANWERLKRFYYRMHNRLWPNDLPSEIQERYLHLSNCDLLEGMANTTLQVADYCVQLTNVNVRHYLETDRTLLDQLARDAHYREDIRRARFNHFVEETRHPNDPHAWIRYRDTSFARRAIADNTTHTLDYRVLRGLQNAERGPARFNLQSWLFQKVEDITGWAFGPQSEGWFATVRAWFRNPNTEDSDWPDVGARWWVRYFFRCPWPTGVDCSRGLGFELGLRYTIISVGAAVVLTSFVSSIFSLPFLIFGWLITSFLLFLSLAYMMSPACLFPTPSLTGLSFALPMCLADDLMAFADNWIKPCYVPDPFPPSMISGNPCPPPGQYVDVISCKDVGVSDGLQNVLYLGYWLFGMTFEDIVEWILSTFLFEYVIPGSGDYIRTTMASFRLAGPTQQQRQNICFWWTLPSVVPIGVFFYVGGMFVFFIVPAVFRLCTSLFGFVMYLPITNRLPGNSTLSGNPASEDEVTPVGSEIDPRPRPRRRRRRQGTGTQSVVLTEEKEEEEMPTPARPVSLLEYVLGGERKLKIE